MATPLDIGLLQNFRIIFPFLFIFCIIFGVLAYTKIFGDNRLLDAAIAIVIAIMSLFSRIVIETINLAAPWFVLLIVFIFFVLMAFMILGVKEGDVTSVLKSGEHGYIVWWLVALILIIVLGSLSKVMAEQKGGFGVANETLVEDQADQESSFWDTLFHPKVLGMIAILLIAMFAVSKLTQTRG